jgi:hypothetical protein
VLATLAAAALLVGSANLAAFAATGGPLLLGKGNTAAKTTKLKTTGKGAALSLRSKPGRAPLKVSNSTKITKLNADLVDGLDGSALLNRVHRFDLSAVAVPTDYVEFSLAGLPRGRYLASFNVSMSVVGGPPAFVGCYVITGSGVTALAPVIALGDYNGTNTWVVNGSGLVDTTSATYRLLCEIEDGTSFTIPAVTLFPASISFTRVDTVSSAARTGTPATSP